MSRTHSKSDFLPSATVKREDLLKLESRIDGSLNEASLEVTILCDGIERSYSGITELLRDGSVPETVETYEVLIQSKGGRARISADSPRNDRHQLYIQGYKEWIIYVRNLISSFYEELKNPLRTIFRGRFRMAPISLTSSIIAGHLFITISPLDIYYPPDEALPQLYSMYLTSAMAFLFSSFRRSLFPYVYWDLRHEDAADKYVISFFEVLGLVLLTLLLLPILGMMLN